MKKFILLLAVSFFFTSCTSMPDQIDDRYLSEKNDNEATVIKDIEQKIISKNKEKQVVEKKLKEITPAPGNTEDELKLLNKENSVIKDQIYFYTKTKDAVSLELKNRQLKENETEIAKKTARYNYQVAEKEMTEADLEMKTNELAVSVSQLNYEKSKIAAAYRDKHGDNGTDNTGNPVTNLFKKNDSEDKYGYKKYEDYFRKQQEELAKSEKKFSDADKKFQEAKGKLQGSNN